MWGRVVGTERRAPAARKPRRLMIDQLEERTLLSISAGGVTDQLINQNTITLPAQLSTNASQLQQGIYAQVAEALVTGKSVATDNNGDFVVTWSQNDGVLDANGNVITDPNTGLAMTDDNVYARYFTNAMQRIDIPTGVSSFQIHYGGDEIQKLTISAATQPYEPVGSANNTIAGSFSLNFGGFKTGAIPFDETDDMATNASNIQAALRALGNNSNIAALQDITVQAVDADNYLINFGGKSNSMAQPLFTANIQSTVVNGLSGFLPDVTATAVRTPGTVTVPVSNSSSLTAAQNMAQTAQNIQYAFAHTTSQIVYTAPYLFPPDSSITGTGSQGPYYGPVAVSLAMPAVSVTARSTTEFDITFTGDAGYDEQPTLQILDTSNQLVQQVEFTPTNANSLNGSALSTSLLTGTFTLITGRGTTAPIKFDSSNLGQVATDIKNALTNPSIGYSPNTSVTVARGTGSDTSPYTLTITWASPDKNVPNGVPLIQVKTTMAATVTVAYGDGKPLAGASVQIIKESSDAFRVNDPEPVWDTSSASRPQVYNQLNAQVAMDADGDFVITWQSYTPDSVNAGSGYDIYARRFSPAGYVDQLQTIQFTPDATAPLSSGTFLLTTGKNVGNPVSIPFYTTDADPFGALATRVQAALVALGYDPATKVTDVQQGASYVLQITWGGNDTAISIPLVQVTTTMAGTVQVTGNLPFVADMSHDGTPDLPIESVIPLGGQFQVNTFTANPQTTPSIGMDENGNFTIAWASEGQGLSFFNLIEAQRFDRDGNRLGNELMVNTTDNTTINFAPYVAMADDGTIAITWSNTADPSYVNGGAVATNVRAKVYNSQGAVLLDEFSVGGGGDSTVAFDSRDDFTISWDVLTNNDNIKGETTGMSDVFAQEYQVYDSSGNVSGAVIQPTFRVNSATADTTKSDFWPFDQQGAQVAMDADGDLTFSYDGFGPDVSETNVDDVISQALAADEQAGYTEQQLAAARVSLESYYGLLRGDANAAMFTQLDADPTLKPAGATTVLTSDDIANATRDGQNATYFLSINRNTASGNFTVQVVVAGIKASVSITPVFFANGAIDSVNTGIAIQTALAGLSNVGINWPAPAYGGPVAVSLLTPSDLALLAGTAWDPAAQGINTSSNFVYEITFQGEVHDTPVDLSVTGNTLMVQNVQVITVQPGATGLFQIQVGANGPAPLPYASFTGTEGPAQILAVFQNILEGMIPGTTVTYEAGSSPYKFDVVFPTPQPQIVFLEVPPTQSTQQSLAPIPTVSTANAPAPTPESVCETYGDPGTPQYGTSIAMTSSGSFVEVWNEDALTNDGSYSNTNFEFRTFQENTDTAGPLVTDFIDPYTGDRMQNGDTITDQMNYIVVTFDSNMMTTGAHSVTNPNNWSLLLNGSLMTNGISNIYYGMNEAALNPLFAGLHAPATNKWQAVIVLNGQGSNQGGTTVPYLQDGHYQLIATTALEDAAGNALARTGFAPNGSQFSRSFNVLLPSKGETLVNTNGTAGNQITTEPNTQATASDANGDYVVVWSSAAGQNLSFALPSPSASGYFRLVFNGTNSSDIYFNSTNLATTAANIQAALATIESGTTVAYDASNSNACTGNFVFDVTFAASSSVVYPPITYLAPASYAAAPLGATMNPTTGSTGLYATLYAANWPNTTATAAADGHQSTPTASGPFFITPSNGTRPVSVGTTINGTVPSGPTFQYINATNVSVACDGTGDFVVTWSEEDLLGGTPDWNVWAQRYTSNGTSLGAAFEVNATTKNAQRYSDVAMDADGDFVVTWQSMGQDGSGYGVYAQRYDNTGVAIGGTNALDVLSFTGKPTSVNFTLSWNGKATQAIVYNPGTAKNYTATFAAQVQAALQAIGANVTVTAVDSADFGIQFIGTQGSKFQPPISINNPSYTGGTNPTATVAPRLAGAPGEFLVNDTTANNQMWPSIAMNATGSFVISWTGYGQNGDAANNSNVYAKQFVANSVLEATAAASTLGVSSATSLSGNRASSSIPGAIISPMVTTTDDPSKHIVAADGALDGVVEIIVTMTDGEQFGGSGSVLLDGIHILTAAHVVVGDAGNLVPAQIQIVFPTVSSSASDASFNINPNNITYTINAQLGVNVFANPNFDGNLLDGGDIAVITLPQVAPSSVQRYDIARQNNAVGQVFTMVGYGLTGTGAAGSVSSSFGTEHVGQNKYEGSDTLLGGAGDTLIFDFDSGQAKNDVFGQLFGIHDLGLGAAETDIAPGDSGGPEFVGGLIAGVNDYGYAIPGTWDAVAGLNSSFGEIGGATNVALYANWIDSITGGSGAETLVNQTTAGDQKWSSVAIDAAGDFVVTWTSYGQDGTGVSDLGNSAAVNGANGVYARRFSSNGTPASNDPNEFRVNTFTAGNQQYSKVAMDVAGDFTIAWESFQDPKVSMPNSSGGPTSYGIYAQRYVRSSLIGNPSYFTGPNGEYETEFAVNTTQDGDQRYPSVAMDDNGDVVVAWSGNGKDNSSGTADSQGVFLQRFDLPTDTAGPRVIQTWAYDATATGQPQEVHNNGNLTVDSTHPTTDITQMVISFSEALNATTNPSDPLWANSVCNTANWTFWQDGIMVPGGVQKVTFGYNGGDHKYEAVVIFATKLDATAHSYKLQALDAIQDVFGNALDGDSDGLPGGNFALTFTINASPGTVISPVPPNPVWTPPGVPAPTGTDTLVSNSVLGAQDSPAVASDASGAYVVVWVVYGQGGGSGGDIVGQRYDQYGQAQGAQFVINTYTTDNQSAPSVAMDAEGDFVVAWAGEGASDSSGVYARVYDQFGNATGDQFLVNQYTPGLQNEPSVAMDAEGDFAVTWTSYGQNGNTTGIYARLFNWQGMAQTGEMQVNTTVTSRQDRSDVAMDQNGDFTVVWESYTQNHISWGIEGQRFSATGAKVGGEFQINQYTSGQQMVPKVAMDLAGDFVVTWESYGQDGSGYGIYARRYNAAGAAQGNAFVVNNLITSNWQVSPDVGMDANGDFIITWSSFGQDQQFDTGNPVPGYSFYGISCRMYNADGSDYQYTDPTTGKVTTREWRVNATLDSSEMTPVIGVGQNEEFAIVWVNSNSGQLYSRLVNPDPKAVMGTTSGTTSQVASLPSTIGTSTFTVSWSGTGVAGASMASYSIYVAADGGPFSLWLNNTTATQATYYGQPGHSYAFYSVGTDSNGIVQTAPAVPNTLVGIVLPGGTTIGLFNPTTSTFYLRDSNTTGFANSAFAYGPSNSNLITIIGDWNGDGVDTIGLYNPTTSMFFLSDSNVGGFADNVFTYGPANAGMLPIVGDWDGNGTDTIGLYNPTTSMFYLKNSNSTGFADVVFNYGPGNATWMPLAGDWTGTGKDTIGLFDPAASMFYLRNSNTTGFSDTAFLYGPGQSGWKPLVGDWTGSGTDTIGLYNPASSMFYLRDSNTSGFSDTAFLYGPANAGLIPLVGNWTGSGQAEMASAQVTASANVPALTQSDLQPIVNEAITLWSQAGLDAATVQKLRQAQFVITDLGGSEVGETDGNVIHLDPNAAGNGWFIDPTPASNEEFSASAGTQQLQAVDPRALDRIDLLTVVEHELGHVAGLGDLDSLADDVMNGVLGTGVRRIASHVDAVLAS
jgi:hypothetical protein